MELSLQEFLDSVQNPNTKKGYRHGIKKFCERYGKSAEEILEMRKDDLTQRAEENRKSRKPPKPTDHPSVPTASFYTYLPSPAS